MKGDKGMILATRKYKAGYEVRDEIHETNFEAFSASRPTTEIQQEMIDWINSHRGEHVIIKSAYTLNGDYVGSPRIAHRLIVKRGIKPELANLKDHVCSIGFCEREQKWYGWSHRAIYGFGVGSEVKEGDCCASSGYTEDYLKEHPDDDLSLPIGFVARDLVDAKQMAIAFADSVG